MSKAVLERLPCGSAVLCDRMDGMESVAVGVWIPSGGRHEPGRLQGVSHFLEHMLFKGTETRSARQVSEAIEGIGGTLNGFTSEECTCFLARVRKNHLEDAVDVLLEMVTAPRLDPSEIEKEKGVILEELRMYRDNPAYHIHEMIQAVMWAGQPLGRSLLGTPGTIAAMKREDIAAYHRRRYAPSRISVVACGALRPEEVVRLVGARVKKRFQRRPRSPLGAIFNRGRHRVTVDTRQVEQVNLAFGFPGYSRSHPDREALILLSIILGGNMSSRLFQEIREKRGWVYSIRSETDTYRDGGALVLTAGLPPEKVGSTVKVIRRALAGIKARRVSARELGRAREYYLGQKALSMEGTSSRMLWLGGNLCCADKVMTPEQIFRKINRVTADDVIRVANRVFREGRSCAALIGPPGSAELSPNELLPT